MTSNPFLTATFNQKFFLDFFESNFDFYSNGILITKNNCNSNIPKMELNLYFSIIRFHKTKFASIVCPFIFKDTFFHIIDLFKISSSLIEKNILQFSCPNLNSTIMYLGLKFYHADLNEQILNR